MKDESEVKRLELIGERFGYAYPETYALIAREFRANSSYLVAIQLDEYFPETFRQMEEETRDEYEEWVKNCEESLDPFLDKFHYHQPQI